MPKITPEVSALLKHLCRTYPAAFRPESEPPVPLKVGLHWDLLQELGADVQPLVLKAALRVYCWRPSYRACLTLGATRVNLKGEPAGTVTEVHQEQSAKLIEATLPQPITKKRS